MRRGFVPRLDYRKVIICLVFLLCIWGVDSRKKKKASASGKAPGELLNEAFDLHKTSRFEEASTAYKAGALRSPPACLPAQSGTNMWNCDSDQRFHPSDRCRGKIGR
eukprot:3527896-Rhodomonas_salina.4